MSIRTLLVDDAPILRQLVRMVLEADGSFTVVSEAGDGLEAVGEARKHQPELILLDVAMPRMGGVEALPLLRAVAPSARVVVFTGFEGPGVVAAARAAGADRVLHKGLDPHALCRELQELVGAPALDAPASACPPAAPGGPRAADSPRRTRSARRARRARLRVPGPVATVLAVALLLSLCAAAVWVAPEQAAVGAYAGGFEDVSFQERRLAAAPEPVAGPAGLGPADAEPGAYTVVVPSLSLRWTVHADGTVSMTSGSLPWPEARAAFAQWYGERGLGAPSFESLRLTTPSGEVLHRDALLP